MNRRRPSVLAHPGIPRVLLAVLLACGCGKGALHPLGAPDADAASLDGKPPRADMGLGLPDGAPPDAADMAVAACAEESHAAVRVPLDVFLLLDASNSMNEAAGTRTKHQVVRAALNTFLQDPLSAGLGVGLSFFPAVKTCEAHAECPANGSMPGRCALSPDTACVVPGQNEFGIGCGGGVVACPSGAVCTQIGQCPNGLGPGLTSNGCVVGTMCPDGAPCRPVRHICLGPRSDCAGTHYDKPGVAFGELPGALPVISAALAARDPAGGTPLPEALTGTLALLRNHLGAHPERKAVLVIASDGAPDATCGGASSVLAAVDAARMAQPSLATYAIGVFSGALAAEGRSLMIDVARAGGTNQPYVLEPDAKLAETFRQALDDIRGAALPCEFLIPASDKGAIDFGKVNVRARGGGRDDLIGYVDSAAKCSAEKGGWHYDADPKGGATPTRVILCPSTCQTAKALARGEIELRFGCKTQVIE